MMRPSEQVCLRCGQQFRVGDTLLSVYDFLVHGEDVFASQSMRFVHVDCPRPGLTTA